MQQELHQIRTSKVTRDYREMYMQMREVNKDLKLHFRKLQEKVSSLVTASEGTGLGKENTDGRNM
jgi:hypothetical protein